MKKTRNLTFIFLFTLIILELLCLIFNIIVLEKSCTYNISDDKSDDIINLNIITSLIALMINITSIPIIMIFGLHSLYFKEKFKLALYLLL